MTEDLQNTRRAAAGRDGARARVRRITVGVLVGAIALAGTIASYVAHAGIHKSSSGSTATTTRVARRATSAQVPVPSTPAAPSLLAPGQSRSQSAPQVAPVQAPAQTQAPPVAVSGGS